MLLLDGGQATALEARGVSVAGPLWSARAMLESPSEVDGMRREFLAAGADVVTTLSYQASHEGFAAGLGLSAGDVDRVLRADARRARAVAESVERGVLVVGSIGPYGAMRHDGSEYTGDYQLPPAESAATLRNFHQRRLEVLAGEVDVLAVETIPLLAEVEVLVELLNELGVAAWVALSATSEAWRSGGSLPEAFEVAGAAGSVVAAGVNCFDPSAALDLARAAVAESGKPAVVYPNSGETWADERWSGVAATRPDDVVAWVGAGARLVGGCCRVTPDQIAAMANALRRPAQRHPEPSEGAPTGP